MKNKVPRYSIIITDFGKIARPSKKKYLITEIKQINKVPIETT
tara:strand:+ start:404 stop:532 length:129 start_codon:yes stop_codon:yes gene_type:complete